MLELAHGRNIEARSDMRKPETIQTLNTLIRICRSTEDLTRVCAQSVRATSLTKLLRSRAEDWARQGDELQALVLMLGGAPARLATASSAALCAWVAVKAMALGASDARSLDTCQHAQLQALYGYDHALSGYLPARIRRTLTLHADRIADRTDAMDLLLGQVSSRSQPA